MKIANYILILLFWGFNICIFSQVMRFEIFNSSNSDLIDGEISCMAIDKYDNKWIAIDHGIGSFDSEMIDFFYDEIIIDGSLYDFGDIWCIAIDNFDKLWIMTEDGVIDDNFELYNLFIIPNVL